MAKRQYTHENSRKSAHKTPSKIRQHQRQQLDFTERSFAEYQNYTPPSRDNEYKSPQRLNRTSSMESVNSCEHCSHNHAMKCCLYIYDDESDILRYSSFKQEIDRPYCIMTSSEDFDLQIGGVTPDSFPTFTDTRIDPYKKPSLPQSRQVIYLRQFVWPVIFPLFHQVAHNPYSHRVGEDWMYQAEQFYPPAHLVNLHMAPLMRQVAIPLQHGGSFDDSQPKIIETHSFFPIHYF